MNSEQSKQLIIQAQVYQQQMQNVLLQKETLNLQMAEINEALNELEKTKEMELYKISGPILIKSAKTEIKKELKDKREAIGTRLKTLERNENLLRTKLTEIRNKLSKDISQ